MTCFLVRDFKHTSQKELHWSLQVVFQYDYNRMAGGYYGWVEARSEHYVDGKISSSIVALHN